MFCLGMFCLATGPVWRGSRHMRQGSAMASRAPNLVVIMSDQHRADLMGCAGATGVLTPNLDALAAEGVRFSRCALPGSAVHAGAGVVHDRALRARSRRVHELGRDRAVVADVREGAARARATTRRCSARRTSTRDEDARRRATSTTSRRGCRRSDSPRCIETGDKFAGATPNRYTDHLRDRGLARRVPPAHRGPQLPGRERDRPERDEAGADVGRDADAAPARRVHRRVARRPRRCEWIEAYDRAEPFFLFVGFPGPHDPWDAPQAAVDRYAGRRRVDARDRRGAPTSTAPAATARLLQAFLDLSDTDDDDRRRDPRACAARTAPTSP